MSNTSLSPHARRRFRALATAGLMASPLPLFSSGCATGPADPGAPERTGQATQAVTQCVTYQRGGPGNVADTILDALSPTSNYGTQLGINATKYQESLLRVDLSSIPSYAIVNSATLTLYIDNSTDTKPVNFHNALAPWAESTVTYASFNQQFDPTVAASLTVTTRGNVFKSVDLTALATAWVAGTKPNYGVLIETVPQSKTAEMNFASSEDSSSPPTFTVCYQTPDNHCGPPSPCQNGGSCVNGWTGYTCSCPAGYTGANCQNDVNECGQTPGLCQNGGTCTNGVNSYSCACAPGYTGTNCQTIVNNCAPNPCQNTGICTNGINSHTCSCPPNFTGQNCQTPNACGLNPCVHGTCTDAGSSYTCACATGYTGTNCDVLVDNCPGNQCANGSTCVNALNSYSCSCLPGYAGTYCQNDLQDCEQQSPCLNGGTCADGVNTYTCSCAPGYTGTNCQIDIDDCASSPCLNGGICVDGVNSFTCNCPTGWSGPTCAVNRCAGVVCAASDQCHVAGTCDPSTGACSNPNAPDGTACSDGNACDVLACQGGTCGAPAAASATIATYSSTNLVGPRGITTGDFNGDGILDVAVSNSSAPSVSVLLGTGGGVLAAPVNYAIKGGIADLIVAADFNRDGHLDLAVANNGGTTVDLLLNNGDGTFAPYVSVGPGGAQGMVTGDFNGDGKADLLVSLGLTVLVELGNGDGTFTAVTTNVGTSPPFTGAVVAADFNGDGKLDFAAAAEGATTLLTFLGNGDGTFAAPTSTPAGTFPFAVAAADFNGDGHVDLVVTNLTASAVSVVLGNGDGTFAARVPYTVGGLPSAVVTLDFNGDGLVDIATVNRSGNTLSVLLNQGAGTFALGATFSTGASPFGVTSGDLDGDGRPDLVSANTFGGSVTVFLDATQPSVLCQHGGTCAASGAGYTCSCPTGWTGTHCQTAGAPPVECPCVAQGFPGWITVPQGECDVYYTSDGDEVVAWASDYSGRVVSLEDSLQCTDGFSFQSASTTPAQAAVCSAYLRAHNATCASCAACSATQTCFSSSYGTSCE